MKWLKGWNGLPSTKTQNTLFPSHVKRGTKSGTDLASGSASKGDGVTLSGFWFSLERRLSLALPKIKATVSWGLDVAPTAGRSKRGRSPAWFPLVFMTDLVVAPESLRDWSCFAIRSILELTPEDADVLRSDKALASETAELSGSSVKSKWCPFCGESWTKDKGKGFLQNCVNRCDVHTVSNMWMAGS